MPFDIVQSSFTDKDSPEQVEEKMYRVSGTITIPFIVDVYLEGADDEQAAAKIRNELEKEIRNGHMKNYEHQMPYDDDELLSIDIDETEEETEF
ncbi:MAG: hypothetical protein BWY61_01974 [Firmicutes bacterium ADurb.Bin354]|jgi:hypothetical protein|nr:MAG: hypothetical protein BWY61_01974 [Firmicutes bacterium ADurb.Bin354]